MQLAFPTLVLEPIIHIFDQELHNQEKDRSRRIAACSSFETVPVNVSIETARDVVSDAVAAFTPGRRHAGARPARQNGRCSSRSPAKHKLQAKAKFDDIEEDVCGFGTVSRYQGGIVNGHDSSLRIRRSCRESAEPGGASDGCAASGFDPLRRNRNVVGRLIKLGVGSVIELNSGVDEPVELVVNGKMLRPWRSCYSRWILRNSNNGDYQCWRTHQVF